LNAELEKYHFGTLDSQYIGRVMI